MGLVGAGLSNSAPGFSFGGRLAEVDLLSRKTMVAIELDGVYHFLGAEDYRRDRRKDLELQRHGYVVLRFLADDVVARLEEIIASTSDVLGSR